MSERVAEEVFREACEAIPVSQPPVDAVVERARDRRTRQLRWTAGAAAAMVLVVGVGTWLGTRSTGQEPLEPLTVTEAENPAGFAWYAAGELHLGFVTVQPPPLTHVVQVRDGVVYADEDGRVVLVQNDGSVTGLGTKEPAAPLTASFERGWVAWVDPDRPELVVHDTSTATELARRALPASGARELPVGSFPVAVDQDKVYYAAEDGDWSWRLPDGEPERVRGGDLLDVGSAIQVSSAGDDRFELRQPLFDVVRTLRGLRPRLSPDGDYVLADVGGDQPALYDAASGEKVETGLDRGVTVVSAAFGPDRTVTYVVSPPADDEPLRMLTCDLPPLTCETITSVDASTVLLPD